MTAKLSMKQLRENAPKWIYPWRDKGSFYYGMWLGLLIAGGFFVFAFTFIQVQMPVMATWSAPQGEVIQVSDDDAVGRWLIQKAQEEGPYPSRYEPTEWDGGNDLEQLLMRSVRQELTSYSPSLKVLPEEKPKLAKIAVYGEPLLPERELKVGDIEPTVMMEMVPSLFSISGLGQDEMPVDVPNIPGKLDPAVALENSRFLLRLDGRGKVLDCLSMAGRIEVQLTPVQNWLKGLSFGPSSDRAERWVAVGVRFENVILSDEPDAD